jgi:hypothetical protein
MPKYNVKRFCEFVSEIEIEASTADDAYDEAVSKLNGGEWGQWKKIDCSEVIEYGFIQEVNQNEEL